VLLITPDGMPSVVKINWPTGPTAVQPARLADVVAAAMRSLANASTRYNQLRAQRSDVKSDKYEHPIHKPTHLWNVSVPIPS
jgi:hypothetical protein